MQCPHCHKEGGTFGDIHSYIINETKKRGIIPQHLIYQCVQCRKLFHIDINLMLEGRKKDN